MRKLVTLFLAACATLPSLAQSANSWQQLSASEHSMLLSKTGHIWTCGSGNSGQLGNGTHGDEYSYDAKDVSTRKFAEIDPSHIYTYVWAANSSSYGIRTDGTLWAWGSNSNGQLGLPNVSTYDCVDVPKQVGTSKWKKIAGSGSTILGIQADGSLWAWGSNDNSMTGLDTYQNLMMQMSPARLAKGKWKDIATGFYHSAAITESGQLVEWGLNIFSSWGTPYNIINESTDTIYTDLVAVGKSTDWVSVGAGIGFTAALKSDGSLWTWGYNDEGQLGQGTTGNNVTPTKVLDDVKAFSVGDKHVMAIKNDGTLWGWGYDLHGELGDGGKLRKWIGPKQIGKAKWRLIECGSYSTIGVQEDGTVWSTGRNNKGQLGLDSTTDPVMTFQRVEVSADDVVAPDTTQTDTTRTDTIVNYTIEDIAKTEGNILQADSSAVLYASLAGGKNMEQADLADAYGIYRFRTGKTITFEPVKKGADYQWASSVYVNGNVYAHRTENESSQLQVSALDTYNFADWSQTSTQPIVKLTKIAGATAFNPKDKTIYGFFQNEWFDTNTEFSSLLPQKDSVKLIHSFVNDNNVFSAFAVNKAGEMYAINGAGNLYRITADGKATEIGFTGVNQHYSSSMTFDYRSGRLYWYAVDVNNVMALYEVNVKTGKAHKVNDGDLGKHFVALFAENPVYGTPDWPTELSFISTTKNHATGTFSCRLPKTTIDGQPLTGSISLRITGDYGEDFTVDNLNPGDVFSQKLSVPAKGVSHISVVAKNSVGYGLIARVKVDPSTATGISAIELQPATEANAPMYNLAGQRVGRDYRGIVIQNGRKFFKK